MARQPIHGEIAEHLGACPRCAAFAGRLQEAEASLRAHHAGVEPDAAFAVRVVSRLPGPSELLGWAALRLLPATLALALVLTAWAALATPGPSSLIEESPTDDVLAWVVAAEGEER